MKTTIFFLMSSIVILIGCSKVQSDEIVRLKQENAFLKSIVDSPPASLDSLYPPEAPAHFYQIKMFEMATPFSGFVIKINEGDRSGAKVLFDSFRDQYTAISELVPQWEKDFPSQPLDELAAIIEEGEPGRIMEAVEKVGNVCHNCHIFNLPKVQQKYHWQDFSIISLTDSVTKKDIDYRQFMMTLDMSFVGIWMELQQGQIEKARMHFENFSSTMTQLKESCLWCHDTQREYYVDEETDAFVSKLGTELQSSSPDMKLISDLSQLIGTENCIKCHLVHIPAAYAKSRWKELEQSNN
jgi:hypothetical protein